MNYEKTRRNNIFSRTQKERDGRGLYSIYTNVRHRHRVPAEEGRDHGAQEEDSDRILTLVPQQGDSQRKSVWVDQVICTGDSTGARGQ